MDVFDDDEIKMLCLLTRSSWQSPGVAQGPFWLRKSLVSLEEKSWAEAEKRDLDTKSLPAAGESAGKE